MSLDTTQRPNPYVGPRPFEPGEKLYGRERETRELIDLLIAERIVLMHSPSGAGKTSLLQTALREGLEKRRFRVSPPIRVSRHTSNGTRNRYVSSVLSSLEEALPASERLSEAELGSSSLSDYLDKHAGQFGNADSQVLVFDQFEEVLSVDPTDREAKTAFFKQLGDALLERRRWALIAIREDYMGGLAPYVLSIPTQLGNTYRLDLLDTQAARQAIQRPARDSGVEFTDAAAEKLVDDLRCTQMQQPDGSMTPQLGLYIEPVQLQVVCLRLWDRLPPSATQIVEDDVSAVGDVDAALAGYYAERVTAIANGTMVSERTIREWFDRELITEHGIRSQVMQERESSRGLKNTAIQSFIQAHIIRADERRGATWFELAHDRLIVPIRANNKAWFEAHLSAMQQTAELWQANKRQSGYLLTGEALDDAEQWAKTHESELTDLERDFLTECRSAHARAERERRANARIRNLVGVALTLTLLAFLLAGSAGYFWNQANATAGENKALADMNAQIAQTAQAASTLAVQQATVAANAAANAIVERNRATNAEATAVALANNAKEQARIAESRRLASQSAFIRDKSLALSLLLATQASYLEINEVRGNLLDTLESEPQLLSYLWGHAERVRAVAFSPDGKTLASGSADNTIILWDAATRQPIGQPFRGHIGEVSSIAFSADGKMLASGSYDKTIILWDVPTRQPIGQPLKGHADLLMTVAFSPDGKTLASGSTDKTIILWDAATRQPIGQPFRGHTSDVSSVAFSSDGKTLVSGSFDKTIILWDVPTRQSIGQPLKGHVDLVVTVTFSPDGKTLASGSWDNTIILWDAATRQPIGQPFRGHTDFVYTVAFSPDGKTLASGSFDKTITLWDVPTRQSIGQPLRGHIGVVYAVAFSPDGKTLASGSGDNTIILWDAATRQPIGQPLRGHTSVVYTVAFSPDGKMLASGSTDKTIILWDVTTRQPIGQPFRGHIGEVSSIAFSADGKMLASGSYDKTIILWDVPTRQPIGQPLRGHTSVVYTVTFSPDGKMLASGSFDKTIILWDVASQKSIGQPLRGSTDGVTSVAFNPDGKTLASGSADTTIILWDAATRQSIGQPFRGHIGEVSSIAFSSDGKTLASGSWDKTIILWDVASQKSIGQPLKGHTNEVNSVAFSPDGKMLASGSFDKTIILWDVMTRQPIGQSLKGNTDQVWSVAFSPDGKTLASGSGDTTIILWDVDMDSWKNRACFIANRNLTREEWIRYINSDPSTYDTIYAKNPTCPGLPTELPTPTSTPTPRP